MKPIAWRFCSWFLACLGLGVPFTTCALPVSITNSVVGAGLVLGVGTYESGSQATFRAVPQVDWRFDHWEGVVQEFATQNPITLQLSPGLQPIAVMSSALGLGRVAAPVGATDASAWSRLISQYGLRIDYTNIYPSSSSVEFRAPDVGPYQDPGTIVDVTIDEAGRVIRGTNALPMRGCDATRIQIYSVVTSGSWLLLSTTGTLFDVNFSSFAGRPNVSGGQWIAIGALPQDRVFNTLDNQGTVSTGWYNGTPFVTTNLLSRASGMAQIAFDLGFLHVEEGDDLLLAARVAPFDQLQWYRDGIPLIGLTNLCINQPIESSGSFQLLAKRGDLYLLTTPTKVRLLPKGYPRVYINSHEVTGAHREGAPVSVALKSSFQGGQTFYTLDGTKPTIGSPRYTAPFTVSDSVVVRAVAYSEDFSQAITSDPLPITVQIDVKYVLKTSWIGLGEVVVTPISGNYIAGSTVEIKAVPGPAWFFSRWEGDASGSDSTINVVMLTNKTVKAVFEPLPRFPISVTTTAGITLGSGTYPIGSEIRVGVFSNPGWQFMGWTGDHEGMETNFAWTVTNAASFVAHLSTPIVRVATGPGQIRLSPDLPLYPYGTEVQVTPLADPGAYQALWGGIGVGLARGAWSFTVTNATPKITALFQALGGEWVGLTLESSAGGRAIQPIPEGIYPNGSSVVLEAISDDGFEFSGWSGDLVSVSPRITVLLDENKSVRASFSKRPVLTLTPLPNESRWRLEFVAPTNTEVLVETSTNLSGWTEQFRLIGQGSDAPVRITFSPESNIYSRFWRLRKP